MTSTMLITSSLIERDKTLEEAQGNMATELRCGGTLHGIVTDDGQHLEVKCKRRSCGARKGVVVLHTISLKTGRLTSTRRFSEPSGKEN